MFSHGPGATVAMPSAPFPALAISVFGILLVCLWRGRLRWLRAPPALAVAIRPRPPAPAAWIAADGDDVAISINGEAVALKPDKRAFAIQQWAQAHTLSLPADPAAVQAAQFDCDRSGCAPKGQARPAIAA